MISPPTIAKEIFILQVIEYSRTKNEVALADLLNRSRLYIDSKDWEGLSAAMHLAKANNREACEFLEFHSRMYLKNDFIAGAALGGHQALAEYFLKQVYKIKHDAAQRAARLGHKTLAVHLDNELASAAKHAAQGGHKALAVHFLRQVELKKRDYNEVAKHAAWGGHQALAEFFLNLIKNKKKRDYKGAAMYACFGHHQAVADYFLDKIKDEHKSYYNWAKDFLKIPEENIERIATILVEFAEKPVEHQPIPTLPPTPGHQIAEPSRVYIPFATQSTHERILNLRRERDSLKTDESQSNKKRRLME